MQKKMITELGLANPTENYVLTVKTDPSLADYSIMLDPEVYINEPDRICTVHLPVTHTPNEGSDFSCDLGNLSSIEVNGVVLVKLMESGNLVDCHSIRIEESQSESRPIPNS